MHNFLLFSFQNEFWAIYVGKVFLHKLTLKHSDHGFPSGENDIIAVVLFFLQMEMLVNRTLVLMEDSAKTGLGATPVTARKDLRASTVKSVKKTGILRSQTYPRRLI